MKLTRIVIAHRPETIAMADRVLVLHGGKVVQDVRQPYLQPAQQPAPEQVAGEEEQMALAA